MPAMDNQFSSSCKGGQVAARVSSQDSAALLLIVEAIGGLLCFVPNNVIELTGRVSFEKFEDLEVRWDGGCLLVSVKDKHISYADILGEIKKFEALTGKLPEGTAVYYRVEATALMDSKARSLCEDLYRLQQVVSTGIDEEICDSQREFSEQHGVSGKIASRCYLSVRDISRDSEVALALFATRFRSVFPVSQYTDDEVRRIFSEYSSLICAASRRRRETKSLFQIRRDLLAKLVPIELARGKFGVIETNFGYVPDPQRGTALHPDHDITVAVRRKVIRRWKKHTQREAIAYLVYKPRPGCPCCNYPIVRTFLGDGAIVCPKCKWTPFMTVFYACDCKTPVCMLKQPPMNSIDIFSEILELVRKSRPICSTCGLYVKEELLQDRMFDAHVPWPIEDYSEDWIIQMRIDAGWEGFAYKNNSETPYSLMLDGRWFSDRNE